MVKTANRDLLMIGQHGNTINDLHEQVNYLEHLLQQAENNLPQAIELFDVNRYRIIRKSSMVARMLQKKEERSFVFYFNKN